MIFSSVSGVLLFSLKRFVASHNTQMKKKKNVQNCSLKQLFFFKITVLEIKYFQQKLGKIELNMLLKPTKVFKISENISVSFSSRMINAFLSFANTYLNLNDHYSSPEWGSYWYQIWSKTRYITKVSKFFVEKVYLC